MTPRERLLASWDQARPDRIPVIHYPTPAGLHVLGDELLQLYRAHPSDNPVWLDGVPHPPPGTVDAAGNYRELRSDEWGISWEFRIFGVWGHPHSRPFDDWQAAKDYRFPAVGPTSGEAFESERRAVAEERRTWLVNRNAVSIFERLCALFPMDRLLMDMADDDPGMVAFIDRLEEYWSRSIARDLALGADVISFGDDWGTQRGPTVSLAMFRRHFAPRYHRLFAQIRAGGARVMFHSCGRLGPLFDELLKLGIQGLWPQIGSYDEDRLFAACRERKVLLYIHPDRQHLVPHGTPAEIDARIAAYAARVKAQGGGAAFYIEIENDTPMANARALIEAVARHR